MGELASLDDRRAARSDEVRRCVCGGEWFRLLGPDGRPPAVTLHVDGSITGYAGAPVCNTCGRAAD